MKIYAPNKNYCGISAGVHFVDGIGETDSTYLIEWFLQHGYIADEQSDTGSFLINMKLGELKEYAESLGIEIKGLKSKAEIINRIAEVGEKNDMQSKGESNTED